MNPHSRDNFKSYINVTNQASDTCRIQETTFSPFDVGPKNFQEAFTCARYDLREGNHHCSLGALNYYNFRGNVQR